MLSEFVYSILETKKMKNFFGLVKQQIMLFKRIINGPRTDMKGSKNLDKYD